LGTAVAIADNSGMVVVGAPNQDLEPSVNGGAVYVYQPSPNADAPWAQRAKVRPQDGVTRRFGNAVAIDSARMVVGAHGDALFGSLTGAAFIFELNGADWAQVQRLY